VSEWITALYKQQANKITVEHIPVAPGPEVSGI
jgi:hypothetical protein